jgi:hypothetical protein
MGPIYINMHAPFHHTRNSREFLCEIVKKEAWKILDVTHEPIKTITNFKVKDVDIEV